MEGIRRTGRSLFVGGKLPCGRRGATEVPEALLGFKFQVGTFLCQAL